MDLLFAIAGIDISALTGQALQLEVAKTPARGRAREFRAMLRQQEAAIETARSALSAAHKQASLPVSMNMQQHLQAWRLHSTVTGLSDCADLSAAEEQASAPSMWSANSGLAQHSHWSLCLYNPCAAEKQPSPPWIWAIVLCMACTAQLEALLCSVVARLC